jgi:dTDP-4-dehydrorhamnose 3,5-epimerase
MAEDLETLMLDVRPLAIPEVIEIRPRKFGDDRGFFAETFNRAGFAAAGIDIDWIQDNQSYSAPQSTLRGLHFQLPPFAQDKLVRVLRGRIFDVAVDIREGSPTYRQWVGLELSAAAFNQLLVPAGFAHGFLTLEADTEVLYKVSAPYSSAHDRSIRWDDADIGIDWPLEGRQPVLSAKDKDAAMLRDMPTAFTYDAGGVRP